MNFSLYILEVKHRHKESSKVRVKTNDEAVYWQFEDNTDNSGYTPKYLMGKDKGGAPLSVETANAGMFLLGVSPCCFFLVVSLISVSVFHSLPRLESAGRRFI